MQMSINVTDRKMVRRKVELLFLSIALSYHGDYSILGHRHNISEVMFEMFKKVSSSLPCCFSAGKAQCSAGFWVQSKAGFHV